MDVNQKNNTRRRAARGNSNKFFREEVPSRRPKVGGPSEPRLTVGAKIGARSRPAFVFHGNIDEF
jgi:hypothetical protein